MRSIVWSSDVCSSDLQEPLSRRDPWAFRRHRLRDHRSRRGRRAGSRQGLERDAALEIHKPREPGRCGRMRPPADRKSVEKGERVTVRDDVGGRRIITKTKNNKHKHTKRYN